MSLPPDLAGVCVGHPDSELWDADWPNTTGDAPTLPALWAMRRVTEAKALCADCPVRQACLDSALAAEGSTPARMRTGTRGGLNQYERALRRKPTPPLSNRKAHGTMARYKKHRRDGDPVCDACREANRMDTARRREFPRKGRIAPALGIGRPL